jgi:uncharacterized repeat protein (TIGR03803 family)
MKRIVNTLGKLNWGKRASAVLALCTMSAMALSAQTLTTLYSFCAESGCTDGVAPYGPLVQATNGKLYGTTGGGGASSLGTVFNITPSGTLTSLYSFDGADGAGPSGALVQDTNGNFYGVTQEGGAGNDCPATGSSGCGTVFRITQSGALTTLYSFCSLSSCADGLFPISGLVQAANGNLYGTTQFGGDPPTTYGTVFGVTLSGTLTTVYSFDYTDGGQLEAGLVRAADGNFYGTALEGGANGYGTVFELTPSGVLTTLYSFCSQSNCVDGQEPSAFGPLVEGWDGNFYGTTFYGGPNQFCTEYGGFTVGCGTVFKITPSGTLTTLYSFCSQSNCADGSEPSTGLVQGSDGNFYGTTSVGGASGAGTVFKITPSGTLTTLYSFCSQSGCTDGSYASWLVQHTDGRFYGTTYTGGAYDAGSVFRLSVGLRPFVETRLNSGKAGAKVDILGTDLTGTTSVTFHGAAATFSVVAPSLITATVPTGATTGRVQVVTPVGTLSSNTAFRVVP